MTIIAKLKILSATVSGTIVDLVLGPVEGLSSSETMDRLRAEQLDEINNRAGNRIRFVALDGVNIAPPIVSPSEGRRCLVEEGPDGKLRASVDMYQDAVANPMHSAQGYLTFEIPRTFEHNEGRHLWDLVLDLGDHVSVQTMVGEDNPSSIISGNIGGGAGVDGGDLKGDIDVDPAGTWLRSIAGTMEGHDVRTVESTFSLIMNDDPIQRIDILLNGDWDSTPTDTDVDSYKAVCELEMTSEHQKWSHLGQAFVFAVGQQAGSRVSLSVYLHDG